MNKQSKSQLENMKFEVAREYGVNLKRGYNGVRKMIEDYQRQHSQTPMQ